MNRSNSLIPVLMLCCGICFSCTQFAAGQTVKGVKVPDGFEIKQVAGDELATNVFSMAVSPKGEVFVAGPGYIKVLVDSNSDGVFDGARLFSNGPKSGAQGICFDGSDLLCTGDGGLLRFSDADQDGVADGKPTKLLSIKTGGEHNAHAIRKGPDGWWYLLAGNATPILPEYFAGRHSPVTKPRAGFLMRISPDWSEKQIFAHGFRNAYDFDFNSLGQVFVYDSDGERDISLPWYQPTRLFRMRPGDDAGWVSAGWKRPNSFFDMPPEVGSLGRGSPTGVVIVGLVRFPIAFKMQFSLRIGRLVVWLHFVVARMLSSTTKELSLRLPVGQFGFAVTDLDFASDGSLLISTGGRGTKGAIYRVEYVGDEACGEVPELTPTQQFIVDSKSEELPAERVLNELAKQGSSVALEALIGRRDILARKLSTEDEAKLVSGLRKAIFSPKGSKWGLVYRVLQAIEPETIAKIPTDRLKVESRVLLRVAGARDARSRFVTMILVIAELDGDSIKRGKAKYVDRMLLARMGQLLLGGCGNSKRQMFNGYTAEDPYPNLSETSEDGMTGWLAQSIGAAGDKFAPKLTKWADWQQ